MTLLAMHNLSGDDCKYYISAAPSIPCSNRRYSPPLQASIIKQIMASHPSSSAKLIKMPIGVSHLALGVCGVCTSSTTAWLHLQTETLGTHKRMGVTSCKDDLKAYSLCILILLASKDPFLILSSEKIFVIKCKEYRKSDSIWYQFYFFKYKDVRLKVNQANKKLYKYFFLFLCIVELFGQFTVPSFTGFTSNIKKKDTWITFIAFVYFHPRCLLYF